MSEVIDGRVPLATLLDHLTEEEWAALQDSMEQRRYPSGESLIRQGTLEPDVHIIAEGLVSVSAVGRHGSRQEIGTLGARDIVGDMSLLSGEPASADVVALTDVVTYSASRAQLAALGPLRGRLIEAVASLLAARLRQANERMMARYTAKTHAIVCSPEQLPALSRLPREIVRAVDAPVLVMFAGDRYDARHVPADDDVSCWSLSEQELSDIPRMLHQTAHDYDRIVVVGDDATLRSLSGEFTSMLTLVNEGSETPPEGDICVLSSRPWSRSVMHALSRSMGPRVVGVIPPAAAPPQRHDPIARLARVITARQVGVALGAGAAKGFAHIGVLKALEEAGITVDVISGCSIGAAIAAGYAAGYSVDELSEVAVRIASRAVRPALPLHSFLSSRGIRDELERVGRGRRFEDLEIPLAICATDIYRRCEVTFTSGLVWPRILASMSIPGIYPALKGPDSYLVDGAVLNPLPSRQCRDLGAGIVIAVRLTGATTSPREVLDVDPSRPYAPETIMRSMEIMHNRLSELSMNEADAVIEVCLERGGLRDFSRSDEFVREGYGVARANLPSLNKVLPYVQEAV